MVEEAKKGKLRKILVTGSSGMLGVDLCEDLSKDYVVIGLDTRAPEHQSTMVLAGFIQCDITDRNKTLESIINVHPDLVIHTAAWTDVDGCEKEPHKTQSINVDGTENIAASSSDLDIPLIYISTDFVFDGRKKIPYVEDDIANPLNIYAKSKLDGEKKVALLNKYIIIRSSWLYGAHGKNFADTILNKAENREDLKVVDDQIGTPTYTKDLAKAIGKLLSVYGIRYMVYGSRKPKWGIYHISNKGQVSWFDYAKELLKLAEIRNIKVIPIKSNQLGRPAKRPAFSVLDNRKFEKATNFTMRPWQEALREYIIHR